MRRNGTFLICGNFSATVADVASDVCIFGDAFFDDGFLGDGFLGDGFFGDGVALHLTGELSCLLGDTFVLEGDFLF